MAFKRWTDYALPNLRIGKVRNQTNGYAEQEPFAGPFAREKLTDDVVTTWTASIVCDMRQSREFRNFIYDVVGVNAGYFYANIKTERSANPQLVRIVSGVPQPTQVAQNAWRYDFTLEAADYTFTQDEIVIRNGLPENYIRQPGAFQEMIRGISSGTPTSQIRTISASRDRTTVIAGSFGGGTSISKSAGASWQPVPALTASGGVMQAVLSSAVSDDGKVMIFGMSKGYAAISRDGGVTWSALPRYLGTSASGADTNYGDVNRLVMSGNGKIIMAFLGDGYVSLSDDGGVSFYEMDRGANTGSVTDSIFAVAMSKSGEVVFACGVNGYASISIDNGLTFSTLPRYLGFSPVDTFIFDAAMSDSGAHIYVVGGNSIGTSGFFVKSKNFGSSFTAGPAVGSYTLSAVDCTPDGETAIVAEGGFSGVLHKVTGYATTASVIHMLTSNLKFVDIATEGQSYYASYGDGYSIRSIPSQAEINGYTDIVYKQITSVVETEFRAGLPAPASNFVQSMAINERNVGEVQKICYVGMAGGYAAYSTDGFTDFTSLPMPFGGFSNVSNIVVSYNGSIVITSNGPGLYASYSGVDSLIDMTGSLDAAFPFTGLNILSVSGSNSLENILITMGDATGYGVVSSDFGKSFMRTETGFGASITDAHHSLTSNDGLSMVVASNDGRAAVSFDSGLSFTATTRYQNSGASVSDTLNTTCGSDDGKYIYVGYSNGYAARSTTSGVSWTAMTRGVGHVTPASTINDMACSPDGKYVVALFDNGVMTQSTDYGATWTQYPSVISGGIGEHLRMVATTGATWVISTTAGKFFVGT